ncbi:hypothetical protein ACOMHN_004056 [Nucella lapillus]
MQHFPAPTSSAIHPEILHADASNASTVNYMRVSCNSVVIDRMDPNLWKNFSEEQDTTFDGSRDREMTFTEM